MAINVDELYQFTNNLIKKNQSGSLSSTVWARYWNAASNAYQDDMVGRFQAKNNEKTGINTGMVENEVIESKLSPFTKKVTITVSSGNGDKPADFKYKLGLRINGANVIHVNKNQIATVTDNVIDPPSINNDSYYFTEYEGYYYFFDAAIVSAELDYISLPVDVKWGFTIDGSGRQVYDPSTSVQPKWDDASCREITQRVLSTIGISYKDADFANFGQKVILTGN